MGELPNTAEKSGRGSHHLTQAREEVRAQLLAQWHVILLTVDVRVLFTKSWRDNKSKDLIWRDNKSKDLITTLLPRPGVGAEYCLMFNSVTSCWL